MRHPLLLPFPSKGNLAGKIKGVKSGDKFLL